MSTMTAPMTSEEMLALPSQERFERWLIQGELRERPMTLRSPAHASATAAITLYLGQWLLAQNKPRPKLCNGDVAFRVHYDPDSSLGADVALATADQAKATGLHDRFIEGPPLPAVEVLSASDTTEEIHEKLREYLDAGTPLIWIVDSFDFTVTVYRPGEEPVLFNRNQNLDGSGVLAGFNVRVWEIFG